MFSLRNLALSDNIVGSRSTEVEMEVLLAVVTRADEMLSLAAMGIDCRPSKSGSAVRFAIADVVAEMQVVGDMLMNSLDSVQSFVRDPPSVVNAPP